MNKTFDAEYAIGIDIGGTTTKFGIVNKDGEIVFSNSISSKKQDSISLFIDELFDSLIPSINDFGGIKNMRGIGIGAPNGNYYTGTIEYAPNLNWKGIIPLTNLITEKFQLPSVLTNDANAAALGEMIYGAAKGMKDFIMMTLGTGVGSGIVANGELIYGHDGFAGELGHTIIIPNGRKHWATGANGSVEAYCSATGVRLTAIEMLEKSKEDSLLRKYAIHEIDSKLVYECAFKNDKIAKQVFNFTGEILGKALANFVMFSSPQAIILFGGLCKAGDLLLKPTKENMEANLLPIFQNKIQLIFSELNESDAAILGASALVWNDKQTIKWLV